MAHIRGIFASLGLAAAFAGVTTSPVAVAKTRQAPSPVSVTAAIDYETGVVISNQGNIDKVLVPASLTKNMAFMVAEDAIRTGDINLDDIVRISKIVSEVEFSEGYPAGSRHILRDVLSDAAVRSNNRAATAIAQHVGKGNIAAFVALMNHKAIEIGMTHTRFVDPSGLSHNNRSSARDLLLMARHMKQHYPELVDNVLSQRSFRGQASTNKLLYSDFNHTGIQVFAGKTGRLSVSGSCLLVFARQDNEVIIALSMGAPDRFVRDARLERTIIDAFAQRQDVLASAEHNSSARRIGAPLYIQQQIELAASRWPSYRLTDARFTADVFGDAVMPPINLLDNTYDWATPQPPAIANRNKTPEEMGVFGMPAPTKPATGSNGGVASGASMAPH